jgi:hypothetical protein
MTLCGELTTCSEDEARRKDEQKGVECGRKGRYMSLTTVLADGEDERIRRGVCRLGDPLGGGSSPPLHCIVLVGRWPSTRTPPAVGGFPRSVDEWNGLREYSTFCSHAEVIWNGS